MDDFYIDGHGSSEFGARLLAEYSVGGVSIERDRVQPAQGLHFIPCGTLHADYENYKEELRWMREHGIYGVKIHPEFQHFALNDARMFLMYEEMERTDMFLIAHMGDPRVDVSGPAHMLPIAETFPKLRCIASHLGNWGDWDVEKIRPLAQLPNGQPLTLEDGGWTMTACLSWEDCSVTAIGMVVLEEDAEEGSCRFTLRLEKTG